MIPITVQILTLNSGATLARALRSVRDFADIQIFDGGSTDDTLAIAERFKVSVFLQPQRGVIEDFSVVRNAALPKALQPWILLLDSDESVSPELQAEIRGIAMRETSPAAYFVPRRYELLDGRVVTHASTYPNARIYFFHRDAVMGFSKPIHERVVLKGGVPVRRLHGFTVAPHPTMEEFKRRNRRYIAIEALKGERWGAWLGRFLRTLRSRVVAVLHLLWIWFVPHPEAVRLPLRFEYLRFWYAFTLLKETCPLRRRK